MGIKNTFVGLAAVLALPLWLGAQDYGGQKPEKPLGGVQDKTKPKAQAHDMGHQAPMVHTSKEVVGVPVENRQGERLGTLHGFAVRSDGEVPFAFVALEASAGGALPGETGAGERRPGELGGGERRPGDVGAGEQRPGDLGTTAGGKLVAVPWQLLEMKHPGKHGAKPERPIGGLDDPDLGDDDLDDPDEIGDIDDVDDLDDAGEIGIGRPAHTMGAVGSGAKFVLDISKNRLAQAPTLDKLQASAGRGVDAEFIRRAREFYEQDPTLGERAKRAIEASAAIGGEILFQVDSLRNRPIQSASGQPLGTIREIGIDANNGRVLFVAVDLAAAGAGAGGLGEEPGMGDERGVGDERGLGAERGLGLGGDLVAVPWKSLEVKRVGQSETIAFSGDEAKLRSAPKMPAGATAVRGGADLAFVERVYQHFGVQPDWSSTKPAGERLPGMDDEHGFGKERKKD